MYLIFLLSRIKFCLCIHSLVFIYLVISVYIIWFYKCSLQRHVILMFPFLCFLSPSPKLMNYLSCFAHSIPYIYVFLVSAPTALTCPPIFPPQMPPISNILSSRLCCFQTCSCCFLPSRSSINNLQ